MTVRTVIETAIQLNVSRERILRLCTQGRLGYTLPRHGRAWVITDEEILKYRTEGPRKPGRPKRKQD